MSIAEQFEFVFLGGGKGGKSLAMKLAKDGRRVAVIERGMIGGSCINVACIPTKALIHSSHIARDVASANGPTVDMVAVRARVGRVVDQMVGINMQAFVASGFDLVLGSGKFVGPRKIAVTMNTGGTRLIQGENVYINTGTVAAIPDIPGLKDSLPMTHVEALSLELLPKKLIVIGGGYIGLELAQAFRHLGSEVVIIQEGSRVALREDPDVSAAIEDALVGDGIEILNSVKPVRVEGLSGKEVQVFLDDHRVIDGTHILVATGRRPVTEGLGLDAAGVAIDDRGFVIVDERLATSAPNTWAIGEVAGTPMFTHASFDDYRVLLGQLRGKTITTAGRVIPYAMFIEPELARVGLNETEAQERGISVRVAKLAMAAVPRARTMDATKGFMKILIATDSDQIVGFMMLGHSAGEVTTVVQMAMLGALPYTAVRDAIISHPLMSEGLNILLANV